MAIYKRDNFDPTVPLIVRFKNQPAVDTGGVLKHFLSCIFEQMLKGVDGIPPLFEEQSGHMLPVYNASLVSSNVMEYAGRVIAHSILLAEVGPQFFSDGIYKYLCSGEFDFTLFSIEDVSVKTRYYIELVRLDYWIILFFYIFNGFLKRNNV